MRNITKHPCENDIINPYAHVCVRALMCVLYAGENADNKALTCKKEGGTNKGIRIHRYVQASLITHSCKRTGNMRSHLFENA